MDQRNDYQPQPGDWVHATFRLRVSDGGGALEMRTGVKPFTLCKVDNPNVVRIEPALPDTEGALVIADVDCAGTCLIRLQNVAPPFGAPGEPVEPDLKWVIAGTTLVIETVRICPGWVVIDPATKRPAGVTR